jgi:pimeloyl-ACP methyl ester carboxylesterase
MRRLKRLLRWTGIGLLVLVLALTLASLVFNAVTSGRDEAAARLYPGPFVQVDGTELAYRAWGSHGSPIVLLGGFIEPAWVWHRVGPLLARTHRVYALDLPPFGYSQRRGPYTLTHWAGLVRAFDQRLGLRRPVVVGHSLGAAVAVSLAARTPRSIRGVVLLDGDARPGGGGASWLSHLLLSPWYTSAYRIVTDWDWVFRKGLGSAWGPKHPHFDDAFVEKWEGPFRVSGTAAAFASMLGHGIQGVSVATIQSVKQPALVAWGADDTVDSASAGRDTARLLHAPFVEIPGAGHLSMLAQPALVARAIDRVSARPLP